MPVWALWLWLRHSDWQLLPIVLAKTNTPNPPNGHAHCCKYLSVLYFVLINFAVFQFFFFSTILQRSHTRQAFNTFADKHREKLSKRTNDIGKYGRLAVKSSGGNTCSTIRHSARREQWVAGKIWKTKLFNEPISDHYSCLIRMALLILASHYEIVKLYEWPSLVLRHT